MKKINLIWLIALFFVSSVSAADPLETAYTFQQNQPADLRISCFDDNNTQCDGSTSCFITVIHPNSSVVLDNVTMTNSGPYHNYSTTSGTRDLGIYQAVAYCAGGFDGYTTFTYEVTSTGHQDTDNLILIIGIAAFFMLMIAYVFRDNIMGFISGTLFIVLGIYSMIYGIGSVADTYTRALAFVSIGIGLLFAIQGAYNQLRNSSE